MIKNITSILLMSLLSTTSFTMEMPVQVPTTDLSFDGGALHAQITWVKGPQVSDESSFRIDWTNDHQAPTQAPGKFIVTIEMPSMPMHNPPTKVAPVSDSHGNAVLGSFLVSNVYFTMGGEWNVDVKLSLPDGKTETESLSLQIND